MDPPWDLSHSTMSLLRTPGA
ncbi:hypothetical protein GQ600_18578 [Phytophthora cactorum]|nr:hypothetical protein GQ600_18578 [Phytophthora cactorum]